MSDGVRLFIPNLGSIARETVGTMLLPVVPVHFLYQKMIEGCGMVCRPTLEEEPTGI